MANQQEFTFVNQIARYWGAPRTALAPRPGVVRWGPVIDPQMWFVIATIPLLIVTLMSRAPIPAGTLLMRLGLSLLLSLVLHQLFAAVRNRPLDRGWIMHGWLYALMLPAGMNLSMTALGLCFGVVIGALIFGGSGRYLVSPALLGYLFLSMSYPDAFSVSVLQQVPAAPEVPVEAGRWLESFLIQTNAVSPTSVSAVACLIGGVVLISAGVVSSRVVAGGLIGAAVLLFAFDLSPQSVAVAPHWNWLLGVFPFCLVFLATDPTVASVTRPGRWCYGLLFGALAILLRALRPDQPESAYAACLLASMFAPLIDHAYLRWKTHRVGSNAHSA